MTRQYRSTRAACSSSIKGRIRTPVATTYGCPGAWACSRRATRPVRSAAARLGSTAHDATHTIREGGDRARCLAVPAGVNSLGKGFVAAALAEIDAEVMQRGRIPRRHVFPLRAYV